MEHKKTTKTDDVIEPASVAELAKALVATPEAQAMLRQSGAKRFDDTIFIAAADYFFDCFNLVFRLNNKCITVFVYRLVDA